MRRCVLIFLLKMIWPLVFLLIALVLFVRKKKKNNLVPVLLCVLGLGLTTGNVLSHYFPKHEEVFHVEVFSPRTKFFGGWSVSHTVLAEWGIIAVVLVLSLLFYFVMRPRLRQSPRGLQSFLEAMIENLTKLVNTKLHGMSECFAAYILSLGILLLSSAFVELLGLHAPTADITQTLSLALITFLLVQYYGLRRKGFFGRLRNLAAIRDLEFPPELSRKERRRQYMKAIRSPSTIGFPFRMISDVVAPLSLACRLFGNMFGGMVIVDLLYFVLGKVSIGIPGVVGLYVNLFHPMIQAFIFITLTLSYIEEATTPVEA